MAEARLVLALQLRADTRPDAIGADQRDTALVDDLTAIAALHGHAIAVRDEVFEFGAEQEPDVDGGLRRGGQRRLQVAAMDGPVRCAVTAFAIGQRNTHDLAAGAAVHHAHGMRRDHRGCQQVAQAEVDEDAGGVGRQLDAGADLFKAGGLFEHGDAQAVARQRQRSGQPSDAGAGHDDMTRGRHSYGSR